MNRLRALAVCFFLPVALISCPMGMEPSQHDEPADATVVSSSLAVESPLLASGLAQFGDYRAPYHTQPEGGTVGTRTFPTRILQNEWLSVTIVPGLGGRIYRLVNRATGNNEFFENPEGFKVNGWGRLGWWSAMGGIELMAPFDEHAGPFYLPWSITTTDRADGVEARLVFDEGAYFGTDRWRFEIRAFLPDDAAILHVSYAITNETGSPLLLEAWSNAMISPGAGNMRIPVSSDTSGVDHVVSFAPDITTLYNHNDNLGNAFWGDAWDTISWPTHTGPTGSGTESIDLSHLAAWYEHDLQFAGLFTVAGEHSGFVAQYNRSTGSGMPDHGEGVVKLVPDQIGGMQAGLKYWHWGSYSATASSSFADGAVTYSEMMTGVGRVFQEPAEDPASTGTSHPTGEPYYTTVAGGGSIAWTEAYVAPFGIDGVFYADEKVALSFDSVDADTLRVGIYPTREHTTGTIVVGAGPDEIVRSFGPLGPGRVDSLAAGDTWVPARVTFDIPAAASSSTPVTIMLSGDTVFSTTLGAIER